MNEISRTIDQMRVLVRWARDPVQRRYDWQSSQRYWRLSHLLKSLQFRFGRIAFSTRTNLRDQRESFSLLAEIGRIVLVPSVLAVILVWGFQFIETRLSISGILSGLLGTRLQVDQPTFANLLGILASISGVFLGLYFTAVSLVAGATYARVPGDIRSLLVQEKIGNIYIRIVALLAAVSTVGLAAITLKAELGLLNLVLVAGLGLISILSFVALGIRTLEFFDPTSLARLLCYDIAFWIRLATVAGFRWQDPSFQGHYQKKGEARLTTLKNVVRLANEPENNYLQGEPLTNLVMTILFLLPFYARQKLKIPSKSRWFKQVYQHRQWLTTDYALLATAINTSTPLFPEEVPDPLWVEIQIKELVVETIQRYCDRNEMYGAIELGNGVQNILESLSQDLAVDESFQLLHALRPVIMTHIEKTSEAGIKDEKPEVTFALGLVELWGTAPISILLGFNKRLRTISADSINELVGRIDWGNERTIYETKMPRAVVEQLESIRKGLIFEKRAEGKIVSPRWYVSQLVALAFLKFLAQKEEKILLELENDFGADVDKLLADKHPLFAAQLIQRGLEACEKARDQLSAARDCFDELSKLRRVQDIPWPSIDWEALKKRIDSTDERLVRAFGRCSIALSSLPASTKFPDYFGHAYTVLAEECFRAMALGNEEHFSKIFPIFFVDTFTAHDKLKEQLSTRDPEMRLLWSTDPIIDIMHLSGYAIVYSELDGRNYWNVAKGLWETYLQKSPNRAEFINALTAIVSYRETTLQGMPRSLIRTTWQQRLEAQLRQRGLRDQDTYSFPRGVKRSRHQSPFIRAIASGSMIMYHDALDGFLVTYWAKLPEVNEEQLPASAKSLAEFIEHELSRDPNQEEEFLDI